MSLLTQPADAQLPLFSVAAEDPNVAWLVELLDGVREWMTAAQIGTASAGRLDDRQVRLLAKAAAPSVISGQRGYKHIAHSTTEETVRAAQWLESQATEMQSRALLIRQWLHRMAR